MLPWKVLLVSKSIISSDEGVCHSSLDGKMNQNVAQSLRSPAFFQKKTHRIVWFGITC